MTESTHQSIPDIHYLETALNGESGSHLTSDIQTSLTSLCKRHLLTTEDHSNQSADAGTTHSAATEIRLVILSLIQRYYERLCSADNGVLPCLCGTLLCGAGGGVLWRVVVSGTESGHRSVLQHVLGNTLAHVISCPTGCSREVGVYERMIETLTAPHGPQDHHATLLTACHKLIYMSRRDTEPHSNTNCSKQGLNAESGAIRSLEQLGEDVWLRVVAVWPRVVARHIGDHCGTVTCGVTYDVVRVWALCMEHAVEWRCRVESWPADWSTVSRQVYEWMVGAVGSVHTVLSAVDVVTVACNIISTSIQQGDSRTTQTERHISTTVAVAYHILSDITSHHRTHPLYRLITTTDATAAAHTFTGACNTRTERGTGTECDQQGEGEETCQVLMARKLLTVILDCVNSLQLHLLDVVRTTNTGNGGDKNIRRVVNAGLSCVYDLVTEIGTIRGDSDSDSSMVTTDVGDLGSDRNSDRSDSCSDAVTDVGSDRASAAVTLVDIFCHQDDELLHMLITTLSIYSNSVKLQQSAIHPSPSPLHLVPLSPCGLFHIFTERVLGYDSECLLELLTCAGGSGGSSGGVGAACVEYLVRVLRWITVDTTAAAAADAVTPHGMLTREMLGELARRIDRLHTRNLYPYNPGPLLVRVREYISQCTLTLPPSD